MSCFLSFTNVDFSYPSSVAPVLEDITVDFHAGWTGIAGDNGAGKTTALLLAAGLLEPSSGMVRRNGLKEGEPIYCAQRTDEPPPGWRDFFWSGDQDALRIMNRLGVGADYAERWQSLSHGERKRAQLAEALWRNPPILALDEPANHLDAEGRALVCSALELYKEDGGVGLLVSHDRALLDRLCGSCFFIRGGRGVMRPGGVSAGLAEEEREEQSRRRVRAELQSEKNRLAAEADRLRREAEHSKNRFSKRFIDPKDHAAKGKINLAKLSGKDRGSGDQFKHMQKRVDRADKSLEAVQGGPDRPTGLTMKGRRARADRIWRCDAGSLPLGGERRLCFPELEIGADDRIAVSGPNGAGKSTLIKHVVDDLRAAANIPTLYVPQEITEEDGARLLAETLSADSKTSGEILSRFSRLGSDPKNLLQSKSPSPGEVRKLLTARGVFMSPELIVMDEPTNHLDLRSIVLLEQMLRETETALLLVSHDEVFLKNLTNREWRIDVNSDGGSYLVLRYSR